MMKKGKTVRKKAVKAKVLPIEDFDDHLEHYKCEWCRESFSREHALMIEENLQKGLALENLQGTLRSYRLYQEELLRRIRSLEDWKKYHPVKK